MDTHRLSLIAGAISSLIFVSSNVPMLLKAYRTKDMRSYSYVNIILVNAGNLIYWLYVVSLPPGPIWILHTFFTISSGSMFVLYLRLRSVRFDSETVYYKRGQEKAFSPGIGFAASSLLFQTQPPASPTQPSKKKPTPKPIFRQITTR